MKQGRNLFLNMLLLALAAGALQADELRLRDGRVIVGLYVGGTQKEVYFQRTPISPEVYPLILVESLTFGTTAGVSPGASLQSPKPKAPAPAKPASVADTFAERIKWVFALFLPPRPADKLAAATH